jgi:hypothetical protein
MFSAGYSVTIRLRKDSLIWFTQNAAMAPESKRYLSYPLQNVFAIREGLLAKILCNKKVKSVCEMLYFSILLGSPLAVAKAAATLPGVHTKHQT